MLKRLLTIFAFVCLTAAIAAQTGSKLKPLTADDLKQLRWIEGSWRGTGGGVPPFFERYRFESGTVLLVEHLDAGKVTSTSRYELTPAHQFVSGTGNSQSTATSLDATSVTFEFAAKERGGYRWQRETADVWKAILFWPASGNRAAGERVYTMERVPAK